MDDEPIMQFLTLFGDSRILLPAAIGLGLWLSQTVSSQASVLWLRTVVLCLLAVVLVKVIGYAGAGVVWPDKISPSGHVAFASLFFAGGSIVAAPLRPPFTRSILAVAAPAVITTVAFSRLALQAHTPLEISLGAGLGYGFAYHFARDYPPVRSWVAPSFEFWFTALIALGSARCAVDWLSINPETLFGMGANMLSE